MLTRRLPLALGCAVALLMTSCGPATSPDGTPRGAATTPPQTFTGSITVLAAASLTESFRTIADVFERRHPGTTVRLSFGASSALAAQINAGAPVDVFASASPESMAQLRERDAAGARTFARNRLQIAVPKGNSGDVTGLADFAREELRIAMCAPQVPCGAAATKAFELAGVAPRPDTFGTDVKAVLTSVRTGEADAGMVYRTDVRAAGTDVTGIDFPQASKAVNDYPIATLTEAPNPKAARAFVAFVRSPAGLRILAAAGFERP